MTERNRKAIVSKDGGSIEVYSEGNRYVIALGFCVWDWIELVKSGGNLPKKARKALAAFEERIGEVR
jgi:hypothetical protein